MPQSGLMTHQLYRSDVAGDDPPAGNMLDGELAFNSEDERLFAKNASGAVRMLASGLGALPVLSADPVMRPGEGAAYIKIVSGQPAVFIKVYGFNAIRLNVGSDLNVDIPDTVLAPVAVNATTEVTAPVLYSGMQMLSIVDGIVTIDASTATSFRLIMDDNIDEIRLVGWSEAKATTIMVRIENEGAYTVSSFGPYQEGYSLWIPQDLPATQPAENAVTSYGITVYPGKILELYRVVVEANYIPSPSPSPSA